MPKVTEPVVKPDPNAVPSTPAPGSVQGKKVDFGKIVSEHLSSIPPASEDAIAAHAARVARESEEDPGKAGSKVRGPYKPRKGAKSSVTPGASRAVVPDPKIADYRKVGYSIADTLMTLGQTLGGEDWKPVSVSDKDGNILFDEKANLREAWADMAEEYQWGKFPAWAAVAIATGTYIAPRLNAPSTKARVSKFRLWYDAWQADRENNKARKAAEKASREIAKDQNA